MPENLFATMSKVEKNSSSNRYFRWEDSAKFQENVTKDTLSQIREKFNPALYSMVAAYYDSADQYLGEKCPVCTAETGCAVKPDKNVAKKEVLP